MCADQSDGVAECALTSQMESWNVRCPVRCSRGMCADQSDGVVECALTSHMESRNVR